MLLVKTSVDPQLPNYPYGMPCDQVLPNPAPTFAPGTTQGFTPAQINTTIANQAIGQSLGLGCADCGCSNGMGAAASTQPDLFTWLGGSIGILVALIGYDYLKKYWRPE